MSYIFEIMMFSGAITATDDQEIGVGKRSVAPASVKLGGKVAILEDEFLSRLTSKYFCVLCPFSDFHFLSFFCNRII